MVFGACLSLAKDPIAIEDAAEVAIVYLVELNDY